MGKNKLRFGAVFLVALLFIVSGCLKPSDPKVGSAGIGVSNLEQSTQFYTQIMGMTIKYKLNTCEMEQVVLEYKDGKGANVVLMHYTKEDPNYADNPDKLVFTVPDAYALAAAIYQAGYTIASPPAPQPGLGNVVVGMAKDPDGYLIEFIQDTSLESPDLDAVGIGVSDLEGSAVFYTEVMGMTEMYRLSLPYFMDEIILEYPESGGLSVVLMHYHPMYNKTYTDLPVKLGFYVKNPKKTIRAIEDAGLKVLVKPKRRPKFNPLAYGLAKDPDGYLLEIKQSVELKKNGR